MKLRSSHDCVGFYLPRGPDLNREFFHEILSWFARKGCAINTIGLRPYFHGIKQFNRVRKKIDLLDLEKAVSLSVNSHAEDAKNQLEDCKLVVALDQRAGTFAISSRNDIYPRGDELLALLKPVVARLQPEYGIGFTRNYSYGPVHYVYGLGYQETLSDEDAENLTGWFGYGHERFVWRHGQIRDVYPWNFLTAPQLNAKVGEATLRDWIGAGPGRGILRPVTGEVLLWDVPELDIPAVRQVLWDAGVIFDYHKIIDQQTNWATEEEVMQWALGGRKPEDVKVLKVEGGGKARELSAEDVERLQGKQGRPK
jgi:hypothetical protein